VTLVDRLTAPGPKRILSLDGGGVRGVLTLGFLKRIEDLLRTRHGRPDLTLADYFDLIGGTSTGAVIAAGLALGLDVASIRAHVPHVGPPGLQPA
jgi:patatin-like phospholipase/acyl hydrolase